MFSLVNPAIMIEGVNAFESLGRSRKLVSKRWGQTFAVLLVVLIIQVIVAGIGNAISGPLGLFSWIGVSVISALFQPLLPLATTLLYYSMRTREIGQKETVDRSEVFCSYCGKPVTSDGVFCGNCGARLEKNKIFKEPFIEKLSKDERLKTTEDDYNKLLNHYDFLYAHGKRILDQKIELQIIKGLSREQAILKLAEKEKLL
jgi:hypothetical protein